MPALWVAITCLLPNTRRSSGQRRASVEERVDLSARDRRMLLLEVICDCRHLDALAREQADALAPDVVERVPRLLDVGCVERAKCNVRSSHSSILDPRGRK